MSKLRFLLAQLHLDSLVGSKSIKSLRKALQELPKGPNAYDHAYKEATDRIQGQPRYQVHSVILEGVVEVYLRGGRQASARLFGGSCNTSMQCGDKIVPLSEISFYLRRQGLQHLRMVMERKITEAFKMHGASLTVLVA